jgi:hypothetical protein
MRDVSPAPISSDSNVPTAPSPIHSTTFPQLTMPAAEPVPEIVTPRPDAPDVLQPSEAAPLPEPGAPTMPSALRKLLDEGIVRFAGPPTEYRKQADGRIETSFEARFVPISAPTADAAAAEAATPAGIPFKVSTHDPPVHSAAFKAVTPAPQASPRTGPTTAPAAHAKVEHPEQNPQDSHSHQQEPGPPSNRPAVEEKTDRSAPVPEASTSYSTRALDAQPAIAAAAPPETRPNPEQPGKAEVQRQAPPDFEPVQHVQNVQSTRTASARDIRLDLSSGEQRVEVRLSERAGELHLAVRTPDERLSGALRDNLPALSSKLEQAGFRSDSAAAALAGARSPAEHPAVKDTNNFANGREFDQGQPQGQPQDQDRRRPQSPFRPEEQSNRKQKGQEFAWLVSSLT